MVEETTEANNTVDIPRTAQFFGGRGGGRRSPVGQRRRQDLTLDLS